MLLVSNSDLHACRGGDSDIDQGSKVGWPKVNASVDEILSLRALHYSWTKISNLLGISRSTLYRHLN